MTVCLAENCTITIDYGDIDAHFHETLLRMFNVYNNYNITITIILIIGIKRRF